MKYVDTHCHLDGEEFRADLDETVSRAREAGVARIFVPGIGLDSASSVLDTCRAYPGYCLPMLGLHPEEVRADWREVLAGMHSLLTPQDGGQTPFIAIGEVGLDYYWSREFEQEQRLAFEEQVRWAAELRLPLMIHCRKAQGDLVRIIKAYEQDLVGGVFHCFTGNAIEAAELLRFERFCLGIGGVLTFKKSNLPEVLAGTVPLSRLVLETDAPYMAPVPMRGKRNEPAFTRYVLERLATAYQTTEEAVASQTNANVERIFGIKV